MKILFVFIGSIYEQERILKFKIQQKFINFLNPYDKYQFIKKMNFFKKIFRSKESDTPPRKKKEKASFLTWLCATKQPHDGH